MAGKYIIYDVPRRHLRALLGNTDGGEGAIVAAGELPSGGLFPDGTIIRRHRFFDGVFHQITVTHSGMTDAQLKKSALDLSALGVDFDQEDDDEPTELRHFKARLNKKTDKKTRRIIYATTFAHQEGAPEFSLSSAAQRSWIALYSGTQAGDITFPYTVSTAEDDEYQIADAAEATVFCLTALGVAETIKAAGRAIKVARNAVTYTGDLAAAKAAVDAIEDNR